MISKYGLVLLVSTISSVAFAEIERGLTSDFSAWLNANQYGHFKFERSDLVGGAYGGKSSPSDQIKHTPIIFLHGNSDIAVGTTYWQTGWTKSIEYFLSKGYTKAELYTTTWGPANKDLA
jgi:triacylglycerol lipase